MRNDEAHRDDITIGEESTAQYVRPGLAVGHIIPDFRLQTADGRIASPVDYKGKRNLAIIFFNPLDSKDLQVIAEVKRRYPEFLDTNTEVLGIASSSIEVFHECCNALSLPFPLLADTRNEATCAYCVAGPMIFVSDRFGELRMQSELTESNLDETLDKALSTLELVELECPECGVSTWPID